MAALARDSFAQIVRKSEPLAAMAAQQFGQKIFVDGNLAVLERGQFALIIVDENDVVAEVGEAGACNQPHVSGTNDSDAHVQTPWRRSSNVLRCLTEKPRGECDWSNANRPQVLADSSISCTMGRTQKTLARRFYVLFRHFGTQGERGSVFETRLQELGSRMG